MQYTIAGTVKHEFIRKGQSSLPLYAAQWSQMSEVERSQPQTSQHLYQASVYTHP